MGMEESRNKKRGTIIEAILSAAIPAVLFMLLCRKLNITPFGDRTFLYEDMKRQYIDFYAYYKAVFCGRDSFLYSEHSGLGSNMLGTWAYYLTSPFLLMFVFVPESLFPTALTFFIMLKISATGLFMWILIVGIDKRFGISREITLEHRGVTLACSTAFAYSGWVISNMTNAMWLDAVMLLPLFCLAMIKTIRKERHGFLLLSVVTMMMIVANYYIAAMTLMFMGLFGVVLLVLRIVNLKDGSRVAAAVLLGIVMDLWHIIPVLESLSGSNKNHFGSIRDIFTNYLPTYGNNARLLAPWTIFPKLFSMTYNTKEIMWGLPNIYFGTVLIIPLLMYFMNRKIQRKEKLAAFVSIAVFTIFFCDKNLDTIAHGGSSPSGYLYRYSFLLSFLCILIVHRELCALEGSSIGNLVFAAFITLTILFVGKIAGRHLLDTNKFLVNLLIVFMSFVTVLMMLDHRSDEMVRRLTYFAFAFVLFTELSLNFMTIYTQSSFQARGKTDYQEKSSIALEKLGRVKGKVENKYRIEAYSPMTPNSSLHFGYSGVTSYNSLLDVKDRLLLFRLGFNDNGLYAPYEKGNTRTADALLGVRYVLSNDNICKEGQSLYSEGIIENRFVLPKKVISEKNVENILGMLDERDNPFVVQQKLLAKFCNSSVRVFDGAFLKTLENSHDSAVYTVTADADGEMYFYMDRVNMQERALAVFVNGKFLTGYGNASCQKVLDLGCYSKGEKIELKITTDGRPIPAEPVVVTENITALAGCVRNYYKN